ncbi:hypothetical protein EGM_21044, partial [Macaca fascicularis]
PPRVYECNKRCKCDPNMCTNRLVQHGLQVRLQLFKTQNKGWGIRCLDDIDQNGGFLTLYAGRADDFADKEGLEMGDEYFANLDHIESVENFKEGYESDAPCSSDSSGVDLKDQEDGNSGTEDPEESNDDSSDDNFCGCNPPSSEETPKNKVASWLSCNSVSEGGFADSDSHSSFKTNEARTLRSPSHLLLFLLTLLIPQDVLTLSSSTESEGESGTSRKPTAGPMKRQVAVKSTRGFALKSTHGIAIKSTNMASVDKGESAPVRKNTRQFYDGEESCYIIDAKLEGNLGRYLNHSCSPNLFVQNVFVDTHDLRFPWVAFFASKRIRAGTELTWDYNYEVGSVEGKELLCCCGAIECRGRLL